jgi:uncharacterized membrane protein
MFHEISTGSLAKAVSWRALGIVVTAAIVWVVTGRLALAVGVGGAEALAKMVLFLVSRSDEVWSET